MLFIERCNRVTYKVNKSWATSYSRWLTKFQLDLLNVDDTHPGLRSILEAGGVFTVRRTQKAFSRSPVDLTLEQTINADAASRRTGLSSVTNSYSARLRWMLTKSARAAVMSSVQEMAGLSGIDEPTADLKGARVKRDNNDLRKVVRQIQDTCNPFSNSAGESPKLFNISTGKAATEETKACLLGVQTRGKSRHDEFTTTCFADPQKFEGVIKKEPLKTFKNETVRNKRSQNKRVASLICTRDLMGRLLILASNRDLDLKYVFSFPLTPVPLSMCSGDGLMVKTKKSALLDLLEKKVPRHTSPRSVDAYVVDGNYLMHTLPPHLPGTYGGLAAGILQQVTSLSTKRVDLVFDAYPIPSIKESERARRGLDEKEERVFIITGPEQHRPRNISDSMKSRSFKSELPKFLASEWESPRYAHLIGERNVFISYLGACYHFFVHDGEVVREEVGELKTNHEEADTLICAHVKSIAKEMDHTCNIVIRGSDKDIAVILLHHCGDMATRIWMDVGTSSGNSRRYIDITAIGASIGQPLCSALPGFHVFTGSDYTSSFHGKGKVRPFAQLVKDNDAQKAFSEMTKGTITDEDRDTLNTFTTKMYGLKGKDVSLNDHRYNIFEKTYRPKVRAENCLAKLKGIDASPIPPCESEVSKHISRSSFVAKMWGLWANADKSEICQHPSSADGWELVDDQYEITWFDGPQLPDSLTPDEDDALDPESSDDSDFSISSSDDEDCLSSDEH